MVRSGEDPVTPILSASAMITGGGIAERDADYFNVGLFGAGASSGPHRR